jgi:hypothetical protein
VDDAGGLAVDDAHQVRLDLVLLLLVHLRAHTQHCVVAVVIYWRCLPGWRPVAHAAVEPQLHAELGQLERVDGRRRSSITTADIQRALAPAHRAWRQCGTTTAKDAIDRWTWIFTAVAIALECERAPRKRR